MVRRYLILLLLLVLVVKVQAQDVTNTTAPIIALAEGNFYALNPDDGSIKQITHHDPASIFYQPYSQQDLAISVDGHYLAYLKTPEFYEIAMDKGLIGDRGEAPANIVLLNLMTGEEKVIAEQQANVKYSDSLRLWFRQNLVWSPDGNQLAYFQYRSLYGDPGFQSQVMVYDRLLDKTSRFAWSDNYLRGIIWLPEGIGAGSAVYDHKGKVIAQYALNDWVTLGHPLIYQNEAYKKVDPYLFTVEDGQTYLMNLLTGKYHVVNGYESSTSAQKSVGSLMFIGDDNNTSPSYVLDPQTGNRFVPPQQDPYATNFVFSPDGQQFAYTLSRISVNISDLKGKELVIQFASDAIVWGNKQYTVASESGDQSAPIVATTYLDTNPVCGALPPVGLVGGGQGRVLNGGSSNRIRVSPFLGSDVIALMPQGAVFSLVDGMESVCNDGMRWVQVVYQDVMGWTVEGADGKAFLEPVQ